MTPEQRRRAFDAERARRIRALGRITAQTRARIVKELLALQETVLAEIKAQPTEWRLQHLQRVRGQLEAAIVRFRTAGTSTWQESSRAAWEAGVALVDEPLAAAGVQVGAMLPRVDDRQLLGLQSFLTDRIADISAETVRRVNAQLVSTLSGVRSPAETIAEVQRIMGISRRRAITITRTELGRAFSTGTHLRSLDAAKRVPGLKKQWRRSGKLHSRVTHDLADGQVRDPDEPFDVGGEQLMYPLDPTGSAKNTINCGCTSLPWKEDWTDVAQPGRSAFTPAELAAQPLRRDLTGPPPGG